MIQLEKRYQNLTSHLDITVPVIMYRILFLPIPKSKVVRRSHCSGDCHVLIVNRDTKKLYELFDLGPKLSNGSYTAGSGATWDLTSYALRPKGWNSADAAGLPMLPLMIRYDEIEAGEINHAIRVTVPHTQNTYIWPARAQAGVANTGYPPMGQRFRLKASFDISGFSPTNQIILKAMKKYGMILADNGWDKDNRKWWIYGVRDDRWNTGDLWDLTSIKGTDFEAVDVSSLMIDSNSGKAGSFLHNDYTSQLPSRHPTGESHGTAAYLKRSPGVTRAIPGQL